MLVLKEDPSGISVNENKWLNQKHRIIMKSGVKSLPTMFAKLYRLNLLPLNVLKEPIPITDKYLCNIGNTCMA